MRIFYKERRIKLSSIDDEVLFSPEVEYYRTNNRYPVVLFGKPITNVYKNINVQILITKACNYSCPFCIERDGGIENSKGKYWLPNLVHDVLTQYISQGIVPNVSITGGEPTLYPKKLFNILDIIGSFNSIENINVNTNGTDLSVPLSFPKVRVNLSRHHYLQSANKQIFGDKFPFDHIADYTNTTLQCVLMSKYINSVPLMKYYMDRYMARGASGFSFRGLTALDINKGYQAEAEFTSNNIVDVKSILDEVATDSEFEFVQQKIGDHYLFEIYKYKGKYVRFTYSNFNWLRKIESEERNNNLWYSRATVIHPNAVYSGWTYDLNKIYSK